MIHIPTQVKEALKKSVYPKNYRFRIMKKENPNELDFEIDNENLVAESVNIDEKMCSGSDLKFGLCEGSTLEFQYFGFPNITGRSVWVFIDCQYRDSDDVLKWYSIPFGRFDVKECSRQASTGIIKAVCYNKLLSQYLDEKANDRIEELTGDTGDGNMITPYAITSALLKDFGVSKYEVTEVEIHSSLPLPPDTPPEHPIATFTMPEVTFKLINDNTTYQLGIGSGYIENDTKKPMSIDKRTVFNGLDEYIYFIRKIKRKMTEFAYANVQNPETFLDNLFNKAFSAYFGLSALVHSSQGGYDVAGRYIVDANEKMLGFGSEVFDLSSLTSLIGITDFMLRFPYLLAKKVSGGSVSTLWFFEDEEYTPEKRVEIAEKITVGQMDVDSLDEILIDKTTIPDVTLRQLQSSMFEMYCQFGKLDRVTDLFSGVTLNGSRLLPSDTLYPSNELKPISPAEHSTRAMYSKLWADEGNLRKFRYLIVTYKGLDEQGKETEKTLQRTVNTHGTDDYYMSDNWLFKNLIWTEEQIAGYVDIMVERMQNLSWFPFEMWNAGLPYLETGDEIEISLGNESYTSYILQKQTKGIQNLQDTYINGTLNIF